MTTIRNHYFKFLPDVPWQFCGMSGLPLPDPKQGPYEFIDCEFHPGIWSFVKQEYQGSEFKGTSYVGGRS